MNWIIWGSAYVAIGLVVVGVLHSVSEVDDQLKNEKGLQFFMGLLWPLFACVWVGVRIGRFMKSRTGL